MSTCGWNIEDIASLRSLSLTMARAENLEIAFLHSSPKMGCWGGNARFQSLSQNYRCKSEMLPPASAMQSCLWCVS